MVMKVITGKSDISAYDEFVKNWKSEGGDTILEEVANKQEKGRPFQCDFQILKDHLLCERGAVSFPLSQNTFCPSETKGKYGNDRRRICMSSLRQRKGVLKTRNSRTI